MGVSALRMADVCVRLLLLCAAACCVLAAAAVVRLLLTHLTIFIRLIRRHKVDNTLQDLLELLGKLTPGFIRERIVLIALLHR